MRIGKALAKGYLAADFREALQRYFSRTQAGGQKSEGRDQRSETKDPEGEDPKAQAGGQKTEDGADQKSEPGSSSEADAAAA